ncbi:MAG TPA: hypothetical protein VFQ78_10340 [Candidatus Udaeobacter sp.]|nr:hypothetical protein [Candidatus Udaeobacter sp.]
MSIIDDSLLPSIGDARTGKHNPATLTLINRVACRRVMRVIASGIEESREVAWTFSTGVFRLSFDIT